MATVQQPPSSSARNHISRWRSRTDTLEHQRREGDQFPPHTGGSPAWFYVPLCSSTARNARESTLTGVLFNWFAISHRHVADDLFDVPDLSLQTGVETARSRAGERLRARVIMLVPLPPSRDWSRGHGVRSLRYERRTSGDAPAPSYVWLPDPFSASHRSMTRLRQRAHVIQLMRVGFLPSFESRWKRCSEWLSSRLCWPANPDPLAPHWANSAGCWKLESQIIPK